MARTFPLPHAEFMDLLPVSTCVMHCPAQQVIARTGEGEILPSDIGPRLWVADIALGKMDASEARPVRSLMGLLGRTGATVMAYDSSRAYPIADPAGTLLGGANPTIASLSSDGRELSLQTLPPGYVLTAGDMISWTYGANPVRYALHELLDGATVGGTGATGLLEVDPPIRNGVTAGTAVSLLKPSCKMQLIPDSYDPGTPAAVITQGISFKLIQTLR